SIFAAGWRRKWKRTAGRTSTAPSRPRPRATIKSSTCGSQSMEEVQGLLQASMIRRMRKLERLGLTEPLGPARWRFSERAEPTLRALGERNDIIKRIHRGLAEQRIERSVGDFALHDGDARQVMGRAFGLDDELRESVYAVVDGVDGRVHHLRLPDLSALGDAAPGSIVELRRFQDAAGRLAVDLE